jgi:hypothetical protein
MRFDILTFGYWHLEAIFGRKLDAGVMDIGIVNFGDMTIDSSIHSICMIRSFLRKRRCSIVVLKRTEDRHPSNFVAV